MKQINAGAFGLAALVVLAGCQTATDSTTENDATIALSASVVGTPISTISVEVKAEDIATPLVFNLDIANGVATGVVTVPAGPARTITVRAFDGAGAETHHGEATVDLRAGTNPTLRITLGPLAGDLPVEVVFTDFTITITPAVQEWCIGDPFPVTFTAIVTNVDGSPLAVQVRWASLNPAIATVGPDGTVTPRARGLTQIVATYAGVGAASTVGIGGCAGTPPHASRR